MKRQDRRTPPSTTGGLAGRHGGVGPAFRRGLRTLAVEDVPLEAINHIDRTFQCRLETSLDDLKQSLAQEGQRAPVDLLAGPPHRIIDGFRRIGAIQELGWPTVQALVHSTLSEEDAHVLAFVKNVVRKNLTPLDKAHAIFKARQRGRTTAEIAQRFQRSERQIQRYEALLSLTPELIELVNDHRISMAHATVFAHFHTQDLEAWVRRCQEHLWPARALERELRAAGRSTPPRRAHKYLRIDGDDLRLYPLKISLRGSPDHLDRAIEFVQEAMDILKEARRKLPRRDPPGTPGGRVAGSS